MVSCFLFPAVSHAFAASRKISEAPRTGFMCVETVIFLDAPFAKKPISGFVELVFNSASLPLAKSGFGAAPQGFNPTNFFHSVFVKSINLHVRMNSAKRKRIKDLETYKKKK